NELRRLRKVLERGEPEGPASGKVASIAVLPFLNRSASADDEYFSDGLADELIGMLGKIRGLRVAARTSAFSFRGRQATVEEIGRALHVNTVLDGSIRRSGERIRISVQLIQVSDGLHLWSETYDRTLDDIFAVQDDIARSAVKELRAALLGEPAAMGRDVSAEVANAAKGRATDPAAHRLYLLGRHFINRLNREDLTRAIQNLNEAVGMDPEFALAWAELGSAYTRAATFGLVPRAEAIRAARDSVGRALAIEPDLVEAHARLGVIRMFHDWDWKGAEASFARALELAPGDAVSLNGAGVLALVLGRVEESITLHGRASEQDPLSASPHANLGLTLHHAGRFAEAEAALRRALEIAPQRVITRGVLARTLAAQGRGDDALAEVAREPDEGYRLFALAAIHHLLGHKSGADAALQDLIERHGEAYAVQVAEVLALRREIDASFEWLDKAYAQRDFGISEIQSLSSFQSLHPDPRWHSLMRKLGFEKEGPA
ncbi:MAG TPA: tetratricopeptide repeat protein, partial [Candidatus Eisenbacteria bacterium]|nr:tetratricopeptide repeat protein [Candidatus Eisenbacteria bacterium]